ncbi:hypothetical protein QVD17_37340 [Tagetes erecta]|uniref:Uncharacterized protein n=1 Tax=Tagetes erecta TaxID=13708 RepID=A0AAD8K0B8_TARER|nr:hypothetical protein QVD17_37340 [Tagetes erecta]
MPIGCKVYRMQSFPQLNRCNQQLDLVQMLLNFCLMNHFFPFGSSIPKATSASLHILSKSQNFPQNKGTSSPKSPAQLQVSCFQQ